MPAFRRRLPGHRWQALKDLIDTEGQNIWKDLMSLWRPSGSPSGSHGLRLAIRDCSLNFYRLGQSIACVRFDRRKSPYFELHSKYVRPDLKSDEYVRVVGADVQFADGATTPYGGLAMLKAWIENSDRHKDAEKVFVDGLIALNANAVDVEMGLPGDAGTKGAKRIDLVILEQAYGTEFVVPWEVKLISNSGLKCKNAIGDDLPAVRKQLRVYREFLSDEVRKGEVAAAYHDACQMLGGFYFNASRQFSVPDLGPLIKAAWREPPFVEDAARLVIFDDGSYPKEKWTEHEAVLRSKGVPLVVVTEPCELSRAMAPIV